MHLLKEDNTGNEVILCCSGDAEIADLFIQASQMYESSRDGENDEMIDNLLLQASQEVENQCEDVSKIH